MTIKKTDQVLLKFQNYSKLSKSSLRDNYALNMYTKYHK